MSANLKDEVTTLQATYDGNNAEPEKGIMEIQIKKPTTQIDLMSGMDKHAAEFVPAHTTAQKLDAVLEDLCAEHQAEDADKAKIEASIKEVIANVETVFTKINDLAEVVVALVRKAAANKQDQNHARTDLQGNHKYVSSIRRTSRS